MLVLQIIITILIAYIILNSCIFIFYFTIIILIPTVKKTEIIDIKEHKLIFLIPCMNEEKVIRNTILSLLELPNSKDIVIYAINDASEDSTEKIISELCAIDKRLKIVNRVKPEAQIGKGEALNYTFEIIKKDIANQNLDPNNVIIGIVDADGKMSLNAISEINKVFSNPLIGAMQSRVRMKNLSSIFERLQDLEFYSAVDKIQKSREYNNTACLGGNGQFSRLSAMNDIVEKRGKPWSKCLLEDFEFGLQIALNGWQIRHSHNVIVSQQALNNFKRFVKQRSRWVQGNLQCKHYFKEIMSSNKLSKGAKIDLIYFMLQPYINITVMFCIIITYILGALYFYLAKNYEIKIDKFLVSFFILTFSPSIVLVADYVYSLRKNEKAKIKLQDSVQLVVANSFYSVLLFPALLDAFHTHFIKKQNTWVKTERVEE
jgi:1,2-diacylglycerol 3-beta-glucosyltransferase